jgi:hypothetical protein
LRLFLVVPEFGSTHFGLVGLQLLFQFGEVKDTAATQRVGLLRILCLWR